MATSPSRPVPHIPAPTGTTPHLSSPRSMRSLRKLQSAQNLSTNYAAGSANVPSIPTLTPHQRQLAHRSSGILREPSGGNGSSGGGFTGFGSGRDADVGSRGLNFGGGGGGTLHSSTTPVFTPNVTASASNSHGRTRSNSDLPAALGGNSLMPSRRGGVKRANSSETNVKEDFEVLVRSGPRGDVMSGLKQLRKLVLLGGVDADVDGMSQLRIYTWLILLNAPAFSTDTYLALVHRGPSPAYSKIRNDTFRTLATDPLFKRRVSEASLIRLLNALAWKLHDANQEKAAAAALSSNAQLSHSLGSDLVASPPSEHPSPLRKHAQSAASTTTAPSTSSAAGGSTEPGTYVQGMNVLCAPFLYAARSEIEAFTAFHILLTQHLPSYVRGAMIGVHRGLALVDKCLSIIDPRLYSFLLSKGMTAEIYAFPSVLTLCACTPPLPEVLCLWDFFFAFGVHLNVLAVVAQLVCRREELMASRSPGILLRTFPPLKAKEIVGMTVSFVEKIPARVYGELVEHGR
ncbi:hypothetical protein MMC25_000044 [Agyrium rufum]|nr:hypothetical protein [Agyrium rufum]